MVNIEMLTEQSLMLNGYSCAVKASLGVGICLHDHCIPVQVWWGTDESDLQHHASGNATSYVARYPNATYVSGVFHHVKLEGLQPATQYFYRCGSRLDWWNKRTYLSQNCTFAFARDRVKSLDDVLQ